MKSYFKLSFLMLVSILTLNSCEKAIDNSIPEGTPRREFYNTQIKSFLTNDSLWITQVQDKGKLSFRVGFIFAKDGTARLYNATRPPLSLIQQLTDALALQTTNTARREINSLISDVTGIEDSQLRNLLLTNTTLASYVTRINVFFPLTAKAPFGKVVQTEGTNTYGVYGDFDSSLTFYNTSFLSSLKQKNEFDFDFIIKSYNRDSLSLEGYYSENVNRLPILKPIKFSDLDIFSKALNIKITTLAFATELKVGGVAITGDGNTYFNTKFKEGHDNGNKSLVFTSVAGQTVDPLLTGINAIKPIEVTFLAGAAKPAVGTVIAKFIGYDITNRASLSTGKVIELVVK